MASSKIHIINPFGDSSGHSLYFSTKVCQSAASNEDIDVTLFTSESYNPSESQFGKINYSVVKVRVRSTRKLKKNYSSIPALLLYAFVRILGSAKVVIKASTAARKTRESVVIHVLGGEPLVTLILIFLLKKRSDKVILNVHNADFKFSDIANRYKRFYKRTLKLIYRHLYFLYFTRLIVHGERMKEDFIERIGLSEDYSSRVDVIKIGLDNNEAFPLVEYNRSLLFFGVIRRDKGLEHLLEALRECKDINLTIAGAPKEYSAVEIKELVEQNGLSDRIKLKLGFVKDQELEQLFRDHYTVVLPYKKSFAAQSVVLTLAIRYGNFIISGDTGQNGYDVEQYGLGKTYQSENTNELSRVLMSLTSRDKVDSVKRQKFIFDNSWYSIGLKYAEAYRKC